MEELVSEQLLLPVDSELAQQLRLADSVEETVALQQLLLVDSELEQAPLLEDWHPVHQVGCFVEHC